MRRVAKMDKPEYNATSQQGLLMLGREHFCRVDASPVLMMHFAQLGRRGGGFFG